MNNQDNFEKNNQNEKKTSFSCWIAFFLSLIIYIICGILIYISITKNR